MFAFGLGRLEPLWESSAGVLKIFMLPSDFFHYKFKFQLSLHLKVHVHCEFLMELNSSFANFRSQSKKCFNSDVESFP